MSATTTQSAESTASGNGAGETQMISGGHLVAKALKAEGIEVIFTLCGGHIIDIYDGCVDEGIEVVDVRHEQVAAHAADGYARITGKPGCAVVTAGPGTTDAVTGVANAFRAESPMLLIGGQGALNQHKMGSLQDLPHVDMMTPITKFAATVPDTERVADMVSMAFRECYQRRARARPSSRSRATSSTPRSRVESARIPEAGQLPRLDQEHRRPRRHREAGRPAGPAPRSPCVLLGSQVWTSRGTERRSSSSARSNVPAYMNGSARGTLPPGDPHHFHLLPPLRVQQRRRDPHRRHAVRLPHGLRQAPARRGATVVQIDMDYRTVGKNRDIDLGLVGDPGAILAAVAQAAVRPHRRRRATRKAWLERAARRGDSAYEKRLPQPAVRRARRSTRCGSRTRSTSSSPRTRIYIGDGGDIVTFSGGVVQPKAPGPLDGPGPARHARRRRAVRAWPPSTRGPTRRSSASSATARSRLTGWDFETLVRFNLPFVGVVGNNSSMNQIRYGQIAKYGEERGDIGNKLGDVQYDQFAQMLGGYGEEVREPDGHPARRCERARESGQAVADQHLGRPRRVRARNHEPDDVQVRGRGDHPTGTARLSRASASST